LHAGRFFFGDRRVRVKPRDPEFFIAGSAERQRHNTPLARSRTGLWVACGVQTQYLRKSAKVVSKCSAPVDSSRYDCDLGLGAGLDLRLGTALGRGLGVA